MTMPWFDPEVLERLQQQAWQARPETLKGQGDFGSYAIANRGDGLASSAIESHNLIHGRQRVAQYAALLGSRAFVRIADMGCGLGLTTSALALHYPRAEVTGFEISADAVEFARRNFSHARFVRMAIAPATPLPHSFDLILCQEFYAFTRTSDADMHRAYVAHFLTHLEPGGILLIELSERDREKSVLMTLATLGMPTTVRTLPFDRIYRYLPLFTPALAVSHLAARALARPLNKCVLIRK